MIIKVTLVSTEVADSRRTVKVNASGRVDPRRADEAVPYGLDSVPVRDVRAFYATTENTTQPDIVVGYVNEHVKAQTGEARLYSTDSAGAFKYNVWLRASGEVLIGDSDTPADYTKHLTQYEALKSAFDDLKGKVNDLITKYNTHVHPATLAVSGASATGSTSATLTTETPATSDMSGAKIDHIKTKA